MPTKTRLDKLSKTARNLPPQNAGPQVDEIRVYDDDGVSVYRTDAEARARHPWLDDPAVCVSVTVSEPAETKGAR